MTKIKELLKAYTDYWSSKYFYVDGEDDEFKRALVDELQLIRFAIVSLTEKLDELKEVLNTPHSSEGRGVVGSQNHLEDQSTHPHLSSPPVEGKNLGKNSG